jgi:hypothetical protein
VGLVYGLGFLAIALIVVVLGSILIGLFPILAPVLLLALGIAWLIRRSRSRSRAAPVESPDAHRHPG